MSRLKICSFLDGFEIILIREQKSEEFQQIGTVLPPLHDRDPEKISISKWPWPLPASLRRELQHVEMDVPTLEVGDLADASEGCRMM